jgi:hypothetical protein
MRVRFTIAAFLVFGLVVFGYAHVRGYSPFTSQFVRTCEKAIKERLTVPSTYQSISTDESRITIAWDEFFAEPERSVSAVTRKAMIQVAKGPPVQYVALVNYQAQDTMGAIIRESATCTFNSLDGSDAPDLTAWVKIDGEHNMKWAARQPNAAILQRRLLEQQ